MSEGITIQINIPNSVVSSHLSSILDHLSQYSCVQINEESEIKEVMIDLYSHCKSLSLFQNSDGKTILSKLLKGLNHHSYNHFVQFLDWVESFELQHHQILIYLAEKVNTERYKEIVEEDDFNKRLVALLLEEDYLPVNDVLKSYHEHVHEQNEKKEEKKDKNEKREVNEVIKDINNLSPESAKEYAAGLTDEKFDAILSSLGLDDAGMVKARKIKQDIKEGKPINFAEIMSFTQEYKETIDASKIDVSKLMSLFMPATEGTSDTPNFDFSSILNAIGPMISNMSQPQKGKRQKHMRQRR